MVFDKNVMQLHAPRGTQDLLSDQYQRLWFVMETFRSAAERFGFEPIETPTFEAKELFVRGVGETTEIVRKEMYAVRRLSNEKEEADAELVLRPEGTAGVVRAYIEHGLHTRPQPLKLYYTGLYYRYERPQAGRWREFRQCGAELFGDSSSESDAIGILLAWRFLETLGLTNKVTVDVNSVGDEACRPKIRKSLAQFLSAHERTLPAELVAAAKDNPLRAYDSKNKEVQALLAQAPQMPDLLCSSCKAHLTTLFEDLDDLGIPYNLNPRLVRGLDYYTRTVFEIVPQGDERRMGVLVGGGRYDKLVESYGGRPTPAFGFAAGVERLGEELQKQSIKIPGVSALDALIVQLGDHAKKRCLNIVADMARWGYRATLALGKESLKAQLKVADRMGVRFAVIVGEREAHDDAVLLRDMQEGAQESVPFDRLKEELGKRLKKPVAA